MTRTRSSALAVLLLVTLASAASAAPATGPLAPGIQAFEARRFEEARKFFAPYAAAHPQDADAAYYLGRTLAALRQTDDAIAWLEKAAKLAPRRSDVQLWLARAYGTAAQQASLLRKGGLAKNAHEAWLKAVELDPGNLDARSDLITFYLVAPGFMGGSVEKAREQAGEIAKRDAVRGAIARANIALDQKDPAAAERIVQEALAKHPGEPQLRNSLGLFYQSQKRWDAAFDVYEAMLAADPDAWNALYQIGRTAALSGKRLDRGAAALQRYLGHTPDSESPPLANAHYRLGMIFEKQGNKAGARAEYQAAIKLDPKLDDARDALKKLASPDARGR
ncbi:MAG TPA: tetratricopeptide repeat protein [Thermoanaerobaculia bacterium]|nr:tetratricopeptide repeat protein [Thermoanaerobaculia bacterium]